MLYYSILVSRLGSGFCRAFRSGLGWRLGRAALAAPAWVPGPALPPYTERNLRVICGPERPPVTITF